MAATMVQRRPLPTGRVCRSLFGPVDHEETNRVLQREVTRIKDEYTRKYNFDFDTDTPLPGLYDWKVAVPSAAPPSSVSVGGGGVTTASSPRLRAPLALRLTINHRHASLSSEGEEDETEPDTPGSSTSEESDCESPSILDGSCLLLRRNHAYDLRSVHPASTHDSTPPVASTTSAVASSSTSSSPSTPTTTTTSTHVHHRRPAVAPYSLAQSGGSANAGASSSSSDCAPVNLDPIVEGCRSPADPNSPSQPRQTKITDFLRQRKRKLSAADSLNKKILRSSPFRAANAAAAAAPAAIAAASPGIGFEAAAATSVQ